MSGIFMTLRFLTRLLSGVVRFLQLTDSSPKGSSIFTFTNFRIYSILILSVLLFSISSSAQTASQLIKAGDQKAEEGDFYAASLYFKDALNKDEANIDLNFKYAEACRMFNDLDGSSSGYRQVIKLDRKST